MNKIDLKKLFKSMTETIKASQWDNRRIIKVTETGFNPMHQVGSGRNEVSRVLSLQTILTEALSVHFEQSSRSTLQELYIYSAVKMHHGWGRSISYLIKLRKNDKTEALHIHLGDPRDSINRVNSVFGYDLSKAMPETFESFKASRDIGEGESFERVFTEEMYKSIFSSGYGMDNGMSEDSDLQALAKATGYKLLAIIPYTHKYWISPKYVKPIKNGVEFGWIDVSTYNSLPRTLRIELTGEVKAVRLSDIGVESSGYYSHDDRMLVLPEEVDAAKSFNRKFLKTVNAVTEEILTSIENSDKNEKHTSKERVA